MTSGPDDLSARSAMDERPLVRLWRYAAGHRRTVVAAISFSVLNKLADVMPELLIGAAVDVVVRSEESLVARVFGVEDRFDQLVVLALINVVVWVVESVTDYVAQLLWRNLAQTIEHEARMDAYRHVQRLELAWFEDQSTGGLLSILNDDVNQLERFLDIGANELVRTLVNVVFVGIFFFVAEPVLGVVAFAPIPLIVWASVRYQRRLEPRYTDVRQAAGDLGALLANNVSGIATIRSFTAEERESDRVAVASGAYREANRRAIKLSSAFIPLIRMAILAAFTVTLVVGGRAALEGSLEVGVFSVLVYMTQRLLRPSPGWARRSTCTSGPWRRRAASSTCWRSTPPSSTARRAAPAVARATAGHVRFRYDPRVGPGAGRHVLEGFDLAVPRRDPCHRRLDRRRQVRWSSCCCACTTPRRGGSPSTAWPSTSCRWSSCAGPSATWARTCSCSRARCAENLAYGRPDAGDAELERAARWPRPTSSSAMPAATTPWWASGARSCRAVSASGCRSPGPSSRTRRCWCSTRRPRRSTTRRRPPSSARSSWWAATAPS